MNDESSKPNSPDPTGLFIHCWRLAFEFNGHFKHGQPDVDPVFHAGEARVVRPCPGLVIKGTLVDCPDGEGETGWVVVDTDSDTVAVESPALSCLMIENAPCHLELVAIPLSDGNGQIRWDWEVYEISPNGPRILVSEPRGQIPEPNLEPSRLPASQSGTGTGSPESR